MWDRKWSVFAWKWFIARVASSVSDLKAFVQYTSTAEVTMQ